MRRKIGTRSWWESTYVCIYVRKFLVDIAHAIDCQTIVSAILNLLLYQHKALTKKALGSFVSAPAVWTAIEIY